MTASVAVGYQDKVDVDADGVPGGTLAAIMATAETVRRDPAATATALRQQTGIVRLLNNPRPRPGRPKYESSANLLADLI